MQILFHTNQQQFDDACDYGKPERVKQLFSLDLDTRRGLYTLIKRGRLDLVKFFSDQGVCVSVIETPLRVAIEYNQLDIVKYLINDLNFELEIGQNYLFIACLFHSGEILEYLLDNYPWSPYCLARGIVGLTRGSFYFVNSKYTRLDFIKRMVELGADMSACIIAYRQAKWYCEKEVAEFLSCHYKSFL